MKQRKIKYCCLLLLFMLFSSPIFAAHSKISISGSVVHQKQQIQFATVALYTQNKEKLLGGAITNEQGKFSIEAPKYESYVLVISSIGFEKKEILLKPQNNSVQKNIELKELVTNLAEVQVKGAAIQNKISKDVVTVTKEMRKGAPTTSWILRKTPGVDVDYMSESITIDGQSNVLLLVDGVRKDPKYIQSLSSKRIDKMEIYRNANGRYAMEGYSAVVNILLKKDYRGLSFSAVDKETFNTSGNNGPSTKFFSEQTVHADYTMNNLLFYGNFNHRDEDFYFHRDHDITLGDSKVITKNPDGQDYNENRGRGFWNMTSGVDYKINKNHQLGIQYGYSKDLDGKNYQKTELSRWVYNNSNSQHPDSKYAINQTSDDSGDTHSGQVTYQGKWSEKSKINIEAYYNDSQADNQTFLASSNFPTTTTQEINNESQFMRSVAEWEYSISNKSTFSVGYNYIWKYSKDLTINDWNNNPVLGSQDQSKTETTRKEQYHRVYANIDFPLSNKITAGMGYGAEWNKLGNEQDYRMLHLPFLRLMYKPSSKINFILNYKVKTDNPFRSQTVSYDRIVDEYAVFRGNPDLKSFTNHRVELGVNMFKGKVRITPYYSVSKDAITTYGLGFEKINNRDQYVYSYVNADKYQKMGVIFSGTIPLAKKWRLNIMGSYNQHKIEYMNIQQKRDAFLIRNQLLYNDAKHGLLLGVVYKNNLYKEPTLFGYEANSSESNLACLAMKNFFKKRLFVLAYYSLPVDGKLFSYTQDNLWEDNRGAMAYRSFESTDISILKGIWLIRVGVRLNSGKTRKRMERGDLDEKQEKRGGLGL